MTPNVQTLALRLAAGRMPLNDVLRLGARLTDCLRHAHEEGYCHGALTPDAVILTATGLILSPAPAAADKVTAYTAPERLQGQPPDVSGDIFSLGAVLYEMFTGRRAFPGTTPGEITAAIESHTPEPIGDTALDRLILHCLAKEPARRWQRVQQVQLEFKILQISARRSSHLPALRQAEIACQAELRRMESALAARLERQFAEAAAGWQPLEAQLTARLEQQGAETTAATPLSTRID